MVTPRQFIAAIGILLAAIGLVFLMLPMQATEAGPFGGDITVECGSPISTSTGAPSTACDDQINGRRAWAVPLLAVGVLAVIGANIVASPSRREQSQAPGTTTPA